MTSVTQCRTCPWKVGCDPVADIPHGYSVDLHERLRGTIAEPGSLAFLTGDSCQRIMACHYSTADARIPCAGWLAHQLGPGNNIWLRIEVSRGRLPAPIVDGAQHPTFDATLPADESAT